MKTLGLLVALIVLVFGVASATKSASVLLDFHGILIVFGGTLAATMLSFPTNFFVGITKVFSRKILKTSANIREYTIREIVNLAEGQRENTDYLKKNVKNIRSPFLADSITLIIQGGIPEEAIEEILFKRSAFLSRRYDQDASAFKTVAKFPPAFGLIGTTLALIGLLQQLGGPNSQQMIGPAMAIGLVATFYGLVLTNLVIIPILENLISLNKEDESIRMLIIDGIRLLRKKEHPKIIEEHLKSYLTPSERMQYAIGRANG